MKKKSRISIIIIIIIVLVCIGCAILSGTPYFKDKLEKLTKKEHFEDPSEWMKEKLDNIKAGKTGQGTACLGGPTGSYLQGPGGVKDCYTLEGKINSVPENFFKKPIFFDNTSLHLQNNLDEHNKLHTSITNTQGKLNFTLNQSESESNFDIVRSPKLSPESYTPSYTPPAKTSEITKITRTPTQYVERDETIRGGVEIKKQVCDGSPISSFKEIVKTIKKTFKIGGIETPHTTTQFDDTPSKEWKPPQPFPLPKNVGHDTFPAEDESSDILLHRFGSDGSSISTGTIMTGGGVQFNNNSSISQDPYQNLEIKTHGKQISFSSGVPLQSTMFEEGKLSVGNGSTNYLTKDNVVYLNKIIDGREPLILNTLTCGDIKTPNIDAHQYHGQNIVSDEVNLKAGSRTIKLKPTKCTSQFDKNKMNITNSNNKTVYIDSTANITFGKNQNQNHESFIQFGDTTTNRLTSVSAEIINGKQPCAIKSYSSDNNYLGIQYNHIQDSGWIHFKDIQPRDNNAVYEIQLVKKDSKQCKLKIPVPICILSSVHSKLSSYMRTSHKPLKLIKTRGDLQYYINMKIFESSEISGFKEELPLDWNELLEESKIDISVWFRKKSENYTTTMSHSHTPFYINTAVTKESSPPK
jgi:hypothetical protein